MANENEKLMKDAQYRKSLSIAFFNATNSAIALVAAMRIPGDVQPDEQIFRQVVALRDMFLEEHKTYYANVIMPVGINFKPEKAIAALKATTTKNDLLTVWNLLSEDERHHDEILKVAQELRKTYPND